MAAYGGLPGHVWAAAGHYGYIMQADAQPAATSSREKGPCCQVPGCMADLAAEPKLYCLKKRICLRHMKADMLFFPGNQLCRYCFQCAKVQPLASFDGTKRSCRDALARRKVRPVSSRANLSVQPAPAAQPPAATALAAGPSAEAWLRMQVQQQAQILQQQQQQLLAHVEREQQIAAAARTLSAAQSMADQLAGALTSQHAGAAAAPAAAAIVPPVGALAPMQQQQLAAGNAGMLLQEFEGCNSRTPSPTTSETDEAPGFSPELAAGAAAAADDDDADFGSFLQSILVEEMEQQELSLSSASTATTTHGAPASVAGSQPHSCSRSASCNLPAVSPDTAGGVAWAPCTGMHGAGSLQHMTAAPATAGGPMRSWSAGAGGSAMLQAHAAALPAAARTFSAGPAVSSISSAAGGGMVPSTAHLQMNTAAQLQTLDSMLQQLQASVKALAAPQHTTLVQQQQQNPQGVARLLLPNMM